jgi:hypothetical protein
MDLQDLTVEQIEDLPSPDWQCHARGLRTYSLFLRRAVYFWLTALASRLGLYRLPLESSTTIINRHISSAGDSPWEYYADLRIPTKNASWTQEKLAGFVIKRNGSFGAPRLRT